METTPTPQEDAEAATSAAKLKTQASEPPLASESTQKPPEPSASAPPASTSTTQNISVEGKPEEIVKTRWTILLYVAADALLANFAVESLKQLNNSVSLPPCPNDHASVVVAAQFAIDAPGGQQIPRYIFDEHSGGSLGESLKEYFDAPDNLTEQEALADFLEWAYRQTECKTDRYALILWGHGPQLMLQPPPGDPTGDSASLYITPEELREAITEAGPTNPETGRRRLSIVGFDCCSMSMFEMADEIRGLADYMVASQEEVPDPSFPYDSLVKLFRRYGNNTELLLKHGVRAYVRTYQDYVCNAITGMKRVTLSALRLDKCDPLEKAIESLSCALLAARKDVELPALLIEARANSRDYAGGLYVDLVEFCTNLHELLNASMPEDDLNTEGDSSSAPEEKAAIPENSQKGSDLVNRCNPPIPRSSDARKRRIQGACLDVLKALRLFPDGTSAEIILVNCSADTRSHGLSIYLPYLSNDQYSQLNQPMVKGGIGTIGKGFSEVLNSAAPGLLMCARRDLIITTESYYASLHLASCTDWYCFIVKLWSRILIELEPNELDFRYSAQQAAVNCCCKRCKAETHSDQ